MWRYALSRVSCGARSHSHRPERFQAKDLAHLPSGGSRYKVEVTRPPTATFPWVTRWDEDEGAGSSCASSHIRESHNTTRQLITWDIGVPKPVTAEKAVA